MNQQHLIYDCNAAGLLQPAALAGLTALADNRQGMWEKLAVAIAVQEKLTPYAAEDLQRKWQSGQAAVAVRHGQIVSYLSLNAHDLQNSQLPFVIYEAASGYTAPNWRARGLNLFYANSYLRGLRARIIYFCHSRAANSQRDCSSGRAGAWLRGNIIRMRRRLSAGLNMDGFIRRLLVG